MATDDETAQVVTEALKERLPGFGGELGGLDRGRIEAFMEAEDFGDPALLSDVDAWSARFAEDQKTGGDPVTVTVIAVCATIAYLQTVRGDPQFASKTVSEVRQIVDKALSTVDGKALLKILGTWLQGHS